VVRITDVSAGTSPFLQSERRKNQDTRNLNVSHFYRLGLSLYNSQSTKAALQTEDFKVVYPLFSTRIQFANRDLASCNVKVMTSLAL
jgi:hypothetical protein